MCNTVTCSKFRTRIPPSPPLLCLSILFKPKFLPISKSKFQKLFRGQNSKEKVHNDILFTLLELFDIQFVTSEEEYCKRRIKK